MENISKIKFGLGLLLYLGIQTFAIAAAPELTILNPEKDVISTPNQTINILGKAANASKVTVNGETVTVEKTTVFAKDKFKLDPGKNDITIMAENAEGKTSKTLTVISDPASEKAKTPLTGIDENSISPTDDLTIQPGEPLKVSFTGQKGLKAQYQFDGDAWLDMTETPSAKDDASNYQAAFCAKGTVSPKTIAIRASAADTSFTAETKGKIEVMDKDTLKMIRVISESGEYLTYGIHEVRLGGPYMGAIPLPKGTLLRVTGKRNNMYRVNLCPGTDAWITADSTCVEDAPGEVPPHGYFTSQRVFGNETSDTLSLPWHKEPFVLSDRFVNGGNAELILDLYGAHDASTWITQLSSRNVIDRIWNEQMNSEWLRVHILLNTPILWGYYADVNDGNLNVYVRKAPKLNASTPFKGLSIAIEAGHGGPTNIGARGVSGSEEQAVNWGTAQALEKILTAKGAKVTQVRVGAENPKFSERIARARNANADLLITIHANAAGTAQGYYAVSGLSCYYKYSFCSRLADDIHKGILKNTDLIDWGLVGNFNYSAIRISPDMPGMLVEQAFMSNPKDEAQLLDPAFRAKIAQGICNGIESYLKDVAKKQ